MTPSSPVRPWRRSSQASAGEYVAGVMTLGGTALAAVALCLVLVVDLTAYLVAGARAQTAADAAALAAVVRSDVRGGVVGDPRAAARTVARRNGAELRRCDCSRGVGTVEVTVVVPVRAIAVTRFAARTIEARARAHLVPPEAPIDRRPFATTGRRSRAPGRSR